MNQAAASNRTVTPRMLVILSRIEKTMRVHNETKAHLQFAPPWEGFRSPNDGAASRYQNEPVPVVS